MVVMESHIGNHHRSFEWYHRWPRQPSLPTKWGSQMYHEWPTSRRCCHDVILAKM